MVSRNECHAWRIDVKSTPNKVMTNDIGFGFSIAMGHGRNRVTNDMERVHSTNWQTGPDQGVNMGMGS